MLPPEQLRGYEDCVSGNPYEADRPALLPKHKSALTRIVHSRHQVQITKPDSSIPSSRQATLQSPDRGKLVDDLEACTRELGEAQHRLSKAEKEVTTLKQQLTSQEQHVHQLNADLTCKREGMRKTAELCTSISSELQDLKSNQSKGPLSLARHQRKAIENLKLDKRDLTKKLTQALTDLSSMESRWKKAQSQAAEAYSHLKTCGQECRNLKAWVRKQDARLEAQDLANEALTRESGLKQAELLQAKTAMKHLRSVQAELNDTKASLRNVKSLLSQERLANQQVLAERDAAEDEIGLLEQRMRECKVSEDVERYRVSLEATERNNRELVREVDALRKRLSRESRDSGVVVSPRLRLRPL
ncbi:uncharacterized protein MYCFIDRAFT_84127 [Pseudocercospora fijiensis CIRAD86]|uniref:Uncharacterized protein n=1 Tax=Pseudocercospora fijiensis (strain CIRAD86) TaxID=383855 RepID=M3B364_PSEFD|nr:uncharacterized protein MYCFIDRAFT_84127 [Pseudocercospora fijiensis CIRAD86]EME83818.1 hypothetical protein MYCFIDRAFT_84127 [Pseudocercospora fijiensis CIRAD86]